MIIHVSSYATNNACIISFTFIMSIAYCYLVRVTLIDPSGLSKRETKNEMINLFGRRLSQFRFL